MWLVVGDWTTDPEGTQCRSRRLTYLGYARVEDKWQLAVKHVTEQERWYEDAPRGEQLNTEEVDPTYSPLLSESRSVRTEALKHLDDLFNELKRECEQVIQNIDAAGKAAQAL